jgi:putative endonuclease
LGPSLPRRGSFGARTRLADEAISSNHEKTRRTRVYPYKQKSHKALYRVTSKLFERTIEHKDKKYTESFTAKYNADKLVYYERFHNIQEAIAREKQIKGGSRKKKIDLLNGMNPEWKNLFEEVSTW